ncbi:hypothetical protein JAAARDRAFT_126643, partial [Jaapia argillacea MUCL 33604]
IIVLHPAHKLSYFRKRKWPELWIDTAVSLVHDEWELNYKPKQPTPLSSVTAENSNSHKYFGDIELSTANATHNLLTEYLASPALPLVTDPIAFWVSQIPEKNPLATMALDFLTAPTASTDVERAFSSGGRQVSKLRHSLADETIRAVTVLGSWSDNSLVPQSDLIDNIQKKTKGKHQAQGVEVVVVDSDDVPLTSGPE